ncbi:hypothetical protein EV195_107222 [Tenacibaculum skagerrakense]|uniref:Uncharacterized protein n=1 Tax=Tenacibaculum skagerrakense TaxID=186571 RepID=A0A4R2NRS8_9FLAO|nr:hypothetical protein [Tenacibaculum skagerrakense]TCP24055.1 hypothetical protein EV195_107222 [Tenacibaculum skagerrakense]
MGKTDIFYFELLKKEIVTAFLKTHSAPKTIEEWKGEEIVLFQEDLFDKVKGKVSEKWFYTYCKNSIDKLPRIDILNLLSKYVGYKNWNDFVNQHHQPLPKKRSYMKIIILMLAVGLVGWSLFKSRKNAYVFCFVDQITDAPITKTSLDIKVLPLNESPLYFKTDNTGCFRYSTTEKQLTFVVSSPYHKTDTIRRSFSSNNNNTVRIASDDYSLMLDYYVNNNVKDWKAHKTKLENLIDANAEIYRFYGNRLGVEIYSKTSFIQLISTPAKSLERIKILDKSIRNGKIVKLKFIVK